MFVINQEYDRIELLLFVGSRQRQSGIIYGNKEPGCIIITSGGKHGDRSGYSDIKNDDGSWSYIGQGGRGDQNPNKIPNRFLTNAERTVLLFSTREPTAGEARTRGNRRKLYKFEGLFEVGSVNIITATGGKRNGDKLVQYNLIPAENIFNMESELPLLLLAKEDLSLRDFRDKIKQQNKKPPQGNKISIEVYRARSRDVKLYALRRAAGTCEHCNKQAPFISSSNEPFLEVHHIFRLADDGPDEPENVAALCPNCHKEAHYGGNIENLKQVLAKKIINKEKKI
jgi:5-methylcytosine-specific restriction protein A